MRRTLWLGLLIAGGCASASMPVPKDWQSVPAATVVGDYCAPVKCAAKAQLASIHVTGNRIFSGSKPLTPEFAAIDSYDVSLDRKEIVFSARRKDNFDVGLVSIDGSDIHWIPEDPADEVNAQWAPRGNKVSYILRTATGSIVRTVHIPTAAQLSVDFPQTQIDALAWEPKAERFAVVIESPDASQRLVSMTYAGENRQEVLAPSAHLDVSIEPIGGVLVMRPNAMRYNERLPLVLWLDRKPFAWSDARAALMKNARVAIAIAPKVSEEFWKEIARINWIDSTRSYVVNTATMQPSNSATVRPKPATIITSDPALPPNRYVRHGNTVSASPAVVQSFAAALIADDLKGTPPPNGRR
ncbi:MAG: TolB family protein [Thermoanaerobaculia bacterium]